MQTIIMATWLFEHFHQLLRRMGALVKSAVGAGDRSFAVEYHWYRAMDMAEFSGGLVA